MSHEHDNPSHTDASAPEGIHADPAPFEPSFQPGSLPNLSVPDLPDDAQGLSAEALAQVPTLTDLVHDEPGQEILAEPAEPAAVTQETPVEADTWVEGLHVRMGKLTDEIHTLNARLDGLEEQNKAKV
ncbi:MAG: hypothetical protein RL707_1828 [Pseudomonadota bacterium]